MCSVLIGIDNILNSIYSTHKPCIISEANLAERNSPNTNFYLINNIPIFDEFLVDFSKER